MQYEAERTTQLTTHLACRGMHAKPASQRRRQAVEIARNECTRNAHSRSMLHAPDQEGTWRMPAGARRAPSQPCKRSQFVSQSSTSANDGDECLLAARVGERGPRVR